MVTRTRPRGGSRRARPGAAAVGAVTVLVLLSAGVTASTVPTLVRPPVTTDPHPADGIVVLGGSPYARYEYGRELATSGLAREVVLSVDANPDRRMRALCEPMPGISVTCVVPDPWTTRGEAREIGRLARERGWESVIVVTQRAHVSRADALIRRCFDGELQMVTPPFAQSPSSLVRDVIYQTGASVKALVRRGC